ncbi:MAG: putative bifunctional diguanylate cyclase/phosphodiesterase, partial [Acidimicrobiia bacterium]
AAHASEYALVFDADFQLAYASPSVVEVTAGTLQPGSEVIQEEMVHPDDFTVIEAGFGELLAAPTGTTRRMEFRLKLGGELGSFRWVDAIVTNLLDDPDVAGVIVNAQDVTERHEHEARLDHLANHDALTELPNRFAFERQLATRLEAHDETDQPLAVCFIDLDHFKRVNDSLGHRAGDELLRIMARRISNVVRDDDFVARLGGDEFVILADNTDLDGAEVLAARLLYAISQDVFLGSTRIHVDASIGVNVTDIATPSDPVEFMRDVDVAMYEAKNRGRSQIVRFDVTLREAALSRLELEASVRRAVASDELVVHYQPLVAATGGDVVGLEALVRWQHPTRGLLPPAEFLAVAAQNGLSARIEEAVLAEVLAELRKDPSLPRVWVNLSALELSRPRHARRITTAAIEADVSLARLGFEVTETVLASDTSAVRENLAWLRDRGARVALDDYGTGYASLANLRQLPIDELKVDQSIIARMVTEPFDLAVVQAIVKIASSLGLGVVAEGVETPAQAAMARDLGIATLQGYLFARPDALDQTGCAVMAERVEPGDPVPDATAASSP